MRALIFVLLVSLPFTSPSPAFAHGDHGDAEQLVQVYEVLTDIFAAYLAADGDKLLLGTTTDEIYIEMAGHQFPVNKSAMHQLLNIATMNYNVRELHEDPALLQRALKLIGEFLTIIPTKVYRLLRFPRLTVANLLQSVEAYTHRLAQSYSPAIFVVIGITQGAWEALESVVMPGGVHVACTVFNGLLLVAVIPLERIGEYSSFAGTGFTYRQRVGLTIKTMYQHARAAIGPRRSQHYRTGDISIALNYRSLGMDNPNALEKLLLEWGFFDGPFQTRSKNIPTELRRSRTLSSDIDFALDINHHSLERFYVAFAHSRGIALLNSTLGNLASKAREDRLLPRNDYLPLERLVGRLTKIQSLYSTSLLMLAASDKNAQSGPVVVTLKQTLAGIIDIHHQIASLISRLQGSAHNMEHAREHGVREFESAQQSFIEIQAEANDLILKLDENSKTIKSNLTEMRSEGSYRSWLTGMLKRNLDPVISKTKSVLASYFRPLCHIAFGGRPLNHE